MWEYSVVFPIEKKDIATRFNKKIQNRVKNSGGLSTIVFKNQEATVLLAVPERNKMPIYNYVIELIADIILTTYKLEFLLGSFNFVATEDINMQAFIKALVVFDSDTDRHIIKQKLKCLSGVIIDSFINFKLKVLKHKWMDLVNLANDNVMYLMSNDTFIELLKFLISNLDFRTELVDIHLINGSYVLFDSTGSLIEDGLLNECEVCNDAFLITSLIALNPKKIKVSTSDKVKDNIISLLYELFSSRVEICK